MNSRLLHARCRTAIERHERFQAAGDITNEITRPVFMRNMHKHSATITKATSVAWEMILLRTLTSSQGL
jgi:hypothetical protein